MNFLVLLPPVAFSIILIVLLLLSYASNQLATNSCPRRLDSFSGGNKSISCSIQPEYNKFFSVMFFFAIMHTMALVVTTAPKDALTLPLIYVAAGALALTIIFRR